ncbi:hypothetical protein [Cerasicoccus fimbriatus]|uniref:hypothetical protein n=1 Tax=Cerasicoccus fimbriatus TaxID=3014554 RepID=UPI0022B43000|nr:hypothetical protein [Cerasicoccus sp. TK19100]
MPRFIRSLLLPLATLFVAFVLSVNGATITDKGAIQYGGTEWGTLFMNDKWQASSQARNFAPTKSNGHNFEGQFLGRGGNALFDYSMALQGDWKSGMSLNAVVRNQTGVQSNMLAYEGLLPIKQFAGAVLEIDQTKFVLPLDYDGSDPNLIIRQTKKVSIPTSEGILSLGGNFTVMVTDGRKFGGQNFHVRAFFDPNKGLIKEAHFSARIAFEPIIEQSLSLASIANRGFADETAGDGQGGWTDQGPEQDLAQFSANTDIAGSIHFDIPSSGNSVVALSKDSKRADKSFAVLDVPANIGSPSYLYLLHASAYTWGQVGQIKVSYRDGSEQLIEVNNGQDVGNWWNPVALTNAALVWSSQIKGANIGIFESRFPLEEKPIEKIAFGAGNDSIWMIIGATTTNAGIALPQPEFFMVRANKDWAPIETPLTVKPGSALDFSAWNHAPAGKFGRVITTPDGHFAFADNPQNSVRFLGANLNFDANFLTKEESDALALRMRQMGYNTVRIHHYDVLLAGGWNPTEYVISEEMLDRLDYLFYAMKKQGLYVSTDLFTIRRIRNEKLKDFQAANNAGAFKALIPINQDAMDEWKRFARDFLTHKNPYTGMTWAEDPALFSICPVNEDTIWAAINADAKVKALYQEGFKEWQKSHPDAQGEAAINEYLAEVQIAADAEMSRFLKDDLGVQALITGNNWKRYYAQTPIRERYDYVDNHGYWDHPNFPQGPWRYPYSNSQRSATQNLADIPRALFLTRVENKPFTITEYNYCYPNIYRNESGPLMGTYSALQDYDGLYRFAWTHQQKRVNSQQPIEGFDIVQDPIGLLNEYIIAMLWLRGDVPVLAEEVVFSVNRERAFTSSDQVNTERTAEDIYKVDPNDKSKFGKAPPAFSADASYLGLTKRISSRYDPDADGSANQAFENQSAQASYIVEQDATEVRLERDGDFLVETPFSKGIVIQQQSLDSDFVRDVTGGPTSVFVGALDQKPLAESDHLLVFHLTNVLNEGMKFGEEGMYQIIDLGSPNKLVKRGSATITVPNQASKPQVFAINLSGERIGSVTFELDANNNIVFQAETLPESRPATLAYEIVR